jgi:hypothetical protein
VVQFIVLTFTEFYWANGEAGYHGAGRLLSFRGTGSRKKKKRNWSRYNFKSMPPVTYFL